MKSDKNRQIQLSQADAHLISRALFAYAEAAYPPGGSECSQASNQTLKDIASRISQSHEIPVEIKKRQMPMIKAAIRWFYGPASETVFQDIDPEKLINSLNS